jgi:transcriptional activator protein UGA3
MQTDTNAAFLPMSLESPALANALVAWSAGHLASSDSSYRTTALEARSNALKFLSTSLSSRDTASNELNAATALVLMTSEVCLGDHTKWYGHLIGLRRIIMSTQASSTGLQQVQGLDAFRKSSEGRWVLRNFAYHDILGSVTLGNQPLIQSHYLEGITDVVDTYLGVACEILISISDISCLDSHRLTNDYLSSIKSNEQIDNCFSSIEGRLKEWVCPPETNSALVSLAHAYRSSALMYLYRRTLRGLKVHVLGCENRRHDFICDLHARIQNEVSITLRNTACIPSSEVVESALLFPLFIAGGEAKEQSHMNMISSRLELMLSKRHFHNIQRALGVLGEVWEQRKACHEMQDDCEVDWKDIMDGQNEGLLLT